uniref:Plastid-targeted protein 4 n=1 Tax=Craterostigma plantagineum TaxID=4153 RepID=Q9ARH2_CRAPL|nr:plastid-targeted protein 4 [Craterostigma plantagineum]
MASSLIIRCSSLPMKPSLLSSSQAFSFNPISNLHISRTFKEKEGRIQFVDMAKKNSLFVVYASNLPGVPPLPSGPPPSSPPKNWIIGFIVSVIIPFFANKLGRFGFLLNRIENAVQQVEDIAEAVEEVAKKADKIAEEIGHDLPEGKLKNLVEAVEDVAERIAKDADTLDNIIDQVQEAADQVEDIVESVVENANDIPKA